MKRLIDANKIEYENIYVYPTANSNYKECVGKSAKIREAETVLTIPENPTNGDVLIALYPNLKYLIHNNRVVTTIGIAASFDLKWWNAPWKEEE